MLTVWRESHGRPLGICCQSAGSPLGVYSGEKGINVDVGADVARAAAMLEQKKQYCSHLFLEVAQTLPKLLPLVDFRTNDCKTTVYITRKTVNYELMRLLTAVRSLKMFESLTNTMILLLSLIRRAITILDCNFYYFSCDHNFYDLFTTIHSNHIITVLPMAVHYQ